MKNQTDIMPNGKTREMHNAYNSQWCKRNRQTMSTLLRAWRGKRMEWLDCLKQGMHCIICGESDYRCLDFHHREPSKKVSEIQRLVTSTADNAAVMEEISKCDVLCANCHRKKHARDATEMVGEGHENGQDRLRDGAGAWASTGGMKIRDNLPATDKEYLSVQYKRTKRSMTVQL